MYIGFYIKYPLSLSDFNELECSRQIFEKCSNIKFHKNLSSGSRAFLWGPTDRRRDMTKLIAAFRNLASSLKSSSKNVSLRSNFLGFSVYSGLQTAASVDHTQC
jgi:hypothetical protein